MFDYLIFANWPKGLYLAQKLAEKNQKVAYVEQLPRLKNPFPLFLTNDSQRKFLESLGFLSKQKEGFCLLSPEGVWHLQDMKTIKNRHVPIQNFNSDFNKKTPLTFKDNWLSYLSLSLTAKIFENNNSVFQNKGVNLLNDYFLFEPSAKKTETFKNTQTNISFLSAQKASLSFKNGQAIISLKEKNLTAKKIICLSLPKKISTDFKLNETAYWQWQAFYLTAEFHDYKEVIPSHFIFLKNVYLPWCYDNLLSVFYRQGVLEVWMKLKTKESSEQFIQQAEKHLKNFFKGCDLKIMNKTFTKGFKVFGKEKLNFNFHKKGLYIENYMDFFHGDLANEIQNEHELFKKLY